jgi:hypothetical protein
MDFHPCRIAHRMTGAMTAGRNHRGGFSSSEAGWVAAPGTSSGAVKIQQGIARWWRLWA